MTKIQKTVFSGLLLAIGIILPQYTAHLAGAQAGQMFLPMHIPVLLSGLLCGPVYGALLGILTPLLSCLITGGTMPSVYPMLPIMCAELMAYGVISGICSQKFKWNKLLSLIVAMVSGRILYGLMYWILILSYAGETFRALSVWAAIMTGIPGIIIQLVFIPSLMFAVNKYGNLEIEKCPTAKMAKKLICSGKASCIAVKDNKISYQKIGRGIAPLIELYENNPEILSEAYVLDSVIGKAAAMILVLGGAKKVYGARMSKSAIDYLKQYDVKIAFGEKVGMIFNVAGTGICPLENSVLNIHDPRKGYEKLKETIAVLISKSSENKKLAHS